ncbi:MAG: xanthine dehydrogenase family protein subunit M [Chloroflexi bacterium]|nr:xanthine dehydrogenase family protein subunit M [Chloroflexota bacterium]
MFPSPFEYQRVNSVGEAVALLAQNPNAKLIAGGHSLLPSMKLRLSAPSLLIDISRIQDLSGIRSMDDGATMIGALTTHAAIASSEAVMRDLPVLADAAAVIGDMQVRNRGTIGGSLSHADPAADYPAVMLALGAWIRAEGPGGARVISADDFFTDLFTTALKSNEVLVGVKAGPFPAHSACAYMKHPHPASGFAVAGVAAVIWTDGMGTCTKASVAVTGATAKAQHLRATEAALAGAKLNEGSIRAAAEMAKDGLNCLSDHYASADYRAHLTTVLARKALMKSVERVM